MSRFSAAEQRALRRGELLTGEQIPFGALVSPNVCKLRGKTMYCATWRIAGVGFETATKETVASKMEYLASVYRNIGGGDVSYWYHRIGRTVNVELSHDGFEGFAAQVDERYSSWQRQRGYSLFESYLTLVFHPPVKRAKRLWFTKRDVSTEAIVQEQLAEEKKFGEICQQLELLLREFGPERLGVIERRGREYSELATFYGFLANGVWREEPLYMAPLCNSVPSGYLHFGDINGRLEINTGGERRCVALLDVVDYPPKGLTGDFDAILGLGAEFIETHSFSTMDKPGTVEALTRQLNQMISGEEASKAELKAVEEAIEEARDGRVVGGTYHFSLALFGRDWNQVQATVGAARRELSAYKLEDCRLVPEGAWFAQLPGNWDFRARVAIMTSRNFAALAPMHTHPTGKLVGNPWGEAVAIVRGSANQPFAFNFHAASTDADRADEKDPGNTVVFGVVGSGKTAWVMFLLAQAGRFNCRILFLDKDRGAEIGIRAFGGSYTVFRRGQYTGLNPFQWPDSPETRSLCRRVVAACVTREGSALSAIQELQINVAVDAVFNSVPHELRRLAAVDDFLPGGADNEMSIGLKKWINDGYCAWVLDSPRDALEVGKHRIYGIDYTVFLDDDEIREPVMLVLMALRDSLIDGTPFISVMDEFWKPFSSKQLADDEKNKQKTGRKQTMINVLMSQSVSDALSHEHARTLVEMTVTKIFLPNPDAVEEDYVAGLGRSKREFELIKGFGQYSRKMLVCQGGSSVVLHADLSGLSDELIAFSGSLDNVQLLDEIRAAVGDDPRDWFPALVSAVRARKAAKG